MLVALKMALAAALAMLGPTVDRIIYLIFKTGKLGGIISIETIAFLTADCILATLLWKDYTNKRSTKAAGISLAIFVWGQILYFLIPKTELWQVLVTFVMQSK